MKRTRGFVVALLIGTALMLGQESVPSKWTVHPSLSIAKHIVEGTYSYQWVSPTIDYVGPLYSSQYAYSGTGLSLQARLHNSAWQNLFLTLSGSMTGYSNRRQAYYGFITPVLDNQTYATIKTDNSLGGDLRGYDFTSYSMGAGVQYFYPETEEERFLLFIGAEGKVHFINSDIKISGQQKLGYSVVAGFDVKPFEFGISYSAFSDIKGYGAFLSLRFQSFGLN
ncbi:MAG: hypothetical protein HY966_05610 [Ignavibacteriales bacterium]|nr:hypothetical protein [Ignavibacteriales bacterium]